MTAAVLTPAVPTVPVDLIDVLEDNHRDSLDHAHVDALAGSIRLRGITTPLKLRALDGGRFALIAGHHRLAAARKLGLQEVPYSLQTNADRHSAEAATENVLRKPLNPLEEARAARRLIDDGCTYQSAAQILGWLRRHGDEQVPDTRLVKARLRILDLPAQAQQLVADGRLGLSVVPRVLDFQALAPELLQDFLGAIAAGNLAVQDLHQPGWEGRRRIATLLEDRARRRGSFAAIFDGLDEQSVRALKLGKRATDSWQQADDLNAQINGDKYYHPRLEVRFNDLETEQALNVGALLVLGEDRPLSIILDRALYRDLARQAIQRRLDELQAQQAAAAAERAEARRQAAARPRTAVELVEHEHRARKREFDRQAHGTNLDLWKALREGLDEVDPADLNVARFFAYGLLGPDRRGSYSSPREDLVHVLAANGIRLVVAEHRTEETPTLKSGRPGRTKITYGDVDAAVDYLWTYVDGAKTAGELYGRVMVVFAAQHYARQCVLPQSRRTSSRLPASKDDIARTAFEKVTAKHLPASHRALQRAVEQAAQEKDAQLEALQKAAARTRSVAPVAAKPPTDDVVEQADSQDDTLETLDRLHAAAADAIDAGLTARPVAWRQVARLASRLHRESASLAHDLEIALRTTT